MYYVDCRIGDLQYGRRGELFDSRSGQQRSQPVISKRNTIAFFVILFMVAIAMSFATYAVTAGS